MKVTNVMTNPSGNVRVLGRASARVNLRDTRLYLEDVYKLLRKTKLTKLEFEALEARLGGALVTLITGCGALGIEVAVTGLKHK